MPDAYAVYEGRYLQLVSSISAANALTVSVGPVPAEKVWSVLAATGLCSVAETQDYWFAILDRGSTYYFPVTQPIEFAMAPATYHNFPLVKEGMELKLFPGEKLHLFRDAATAGSTITIAIRYIESELELYKQYEKQKDIIEQLRKRGSVTRPARGASFSGYAPAPGTGGDRGGGGGRGLPK